MSKQFTQVDILRAELLQNLEDAGGTVTSFFSDIVSLEVVSRIEEVTQTIVSSLSREEAPVFVFKSRSRWSNVRFNKSVGLYMQTGGTISALRSDCPSSVIKFALIVKALSTIYKLIQSDSYVTKREIFYNDPQLFGSQKTLDAIVDDVSCLLKVPRRSLHVCATTKGLISGDLCYTEEDGTRVDCSSTAVPVSPCVSGIMNIVSSAKFVLVIEKDATFQTLLDDAFCTQYYPCIIITGKGVPDVNSRLMVKKLWDTLHIPVFALVDADPHGIEIMCIYKYGSISMAFEAPTLAVSSMLWLGLLPSDIESLRVPQDVLISLTVADERKLNHMKKRPYISCHPAWEREACMNYFQIANEKQAHDNLHWAGP
ncbi:meiotic recombination protein SPO11 isoform X2 [Tachysurus vachellii]|uniref:meiotic recombination protein SPO11 isoform X2 n=1 Tax=Tachysurus vachellii TaxID=175792 RepID=UPI00296A9AB1|nr:meiotic recombination protein SPO11 isoform X2 [Tachysurus vachellii]